MMNEIKHAKSHTWVERASQVIPGGVNSPVRSFKHIGIEPVYFERGEGAMLYDVDGNSYVDFCLSFGPHLLGHSAPPVVAAIRDQAGRATSFGACHPKEVELAEQILRGYPFLDRVRLVNSGTEAVMTAIRLARGKTGRDKVIKFEGCYHGHSDGLLAKAGSGIAALSEADSKGVPQAVVKDTLTARFEDHASLEALFTAHPGQIAALILEPVPANYGLLLPHREAIIRMCRLAKSHGAVVIFDEVINGFRLGLSGACGHFDMPHDLVDLVTLGKIVGGGLPLAAVVGKSEIMSILAPSGGVYQAGTLSGNPLACSAGLAVLKEVFEKSPYEVLDKNCERFTRSLEMVLKPWGVLQIRRLGSMFWLHFGQESLSFPPEITPESAKQYAAFFKAALAEGVYFPPSPYEVAFLSTCHTPELLESVLEKLKRCRS